jgi:acyl carrier protein
MGQSREALIKDIVDLVFTSVNLRHKNRDEVSADTPLVESGLNLDSLDILEIVVAIENRYQVKITDGAEGRRIFQNIGTIADFVQAKTA